MIVQKKNPMENFSLEMESYQMIELCNNECKCCRCRLIIKSLRVVITATALDSNDEKCSIPVRKAQRSNKKSLRCSCAYYCIYMSKSQRKTL